MKYYFITTCLIFFQTIAQGDVHNVGPSQTYASPYALFVSNAVNHGDTIKIYYDTYSGTAALANWTKNNLRIVGVGSRPHMKANGQNIGGKAIWIVSGHNCTIHNIEFSDCTVPDQNGAGIRSEGIGMTIRNCYFHNNENGILTNNSNAGHIDIQNTEFGYNGFGDGFSHNVYIGHVSKLTFMYNYSHHANEGHNLKSRANENIIICNRIMDEETGNSSRLIDLSNGGLSFIIGNLFMQGENAVNNNLIGYGLEGLTNDLKEIYVINNSLVNKRVSSCVFLHFQSGTTIAQVINNIFAGNGILINGSATTVSNNYISTNISSVMFVDEINYDYHLLSSSPAVDQGAPLGSIYGFDLIPYGEYIHSSSHTFRILNSQIDIGGYEYRLPCTPLPTYTFNGTFNEQWTNDANWDSNCVPPTSYAGSIIINANCEASGVNIHHFLPNATLTVQSGKTLSWKW